MVVRALTDSSEVTWWSYLNILTFFLNLISLFAYKFLLQLLLLYNFMHLMYTFERILDNPLKCMITPLFFQQLQIYECFPLSGQCFKILKIWQILHAITCYYLQFRKAFSHIWMSQASSGHKWSMLHWIIAYNSDQLPLFCYSFISN